MFSVQAVAAAALGLVTWLNGPSLPAIYGLTFVAGVGFALSLPALLALLPALVPREQLSGAVSLNAAGINVARLAGPAIGGVDAGVRGRPRLLLRERASRSRPWCSCSRGASRGRSTTRAPACACARRSPTAGATRPSGGC